MLTTATHHYSRLTIYELGFTISDTQTKSGERPNAETTLSPILDRRVCMHLAGGHPLEEFLDDFPTVRREQATALLHKLEESLVTAEI